MKRLALLAPALGLLFATGCQSAEAAGSSASWRQVDTGGSFWKHWGDGKAELAGYEIEYPRYGVPRSGTAVTIFVSETFSRSARVKADPGRHPKSDEFPVMKLNLVEDYATGIYDYNQLTSTFVALTAEAGRPAGSTTKVSFSAQEWCGHAYHQLLFDEKQVRSTSHSYFDGEADRDDKLKRAEGGIPADSLMFWARGLHAPVLGKGESTPVKLLRSLATARLRHQDLGWMNATLSRSAEASERTVPAGTFAVETLRAESPDGTWTFYVEAAAPHRIIEWESSAGHRGKLLKSTRQPYWMLNGPGRERMLGELGLTPRPPNTP